MITQQLRPEVFRAHEKPVMTVVFSPNGEWTLTGDIDRTIRLWRDGSVVAVHDLRSADPKVWPSERLRSAVFSPDSSKLYVASGDRLRAYDMTTGEIAWSFIPNRRLCFLVVSPLSIAVDPTGRVLASTNAGMMHLWDPSGRSLSAWRDAECPTHLGISADGQHWVGTDGFKTALWEVGTGLKTMRTTFDERVYSLATSPIENTAAFRSLHGVSIVDLSSLQPDKVLPVGVGLPLVAFAPDGREIAVGHEHGISLYDRGGSKAGSIEISDATLLALNYSPDGSLAAGCSDCSFRIWHKA